MTREEEFKVVRQDAQAALNVPARLLIYQGRDRKTRLAYDLPSSLMSHIGNIEFDAGARSLDAQVIGQ